MPELPEVETIKRGLEKYVIRKKIKQVFVYENKSFVGDEQNIVGSCIKNLYRKGKALFFELSNGYTMMIHLRMTGQIIFLGKERFAGGHPSENFLDELPNKQTRIQFSFSSGDQMFFNDQRKFGFVKIILTKDVSEEDFVRRLGKEPWEMSGEDLYKKIVQRNADIKSALLNQEIIAGLGNIYVDETLFDSNISPKRKCCDITEMEAEQIICSARKVMEKSIQAGGSTIKNYVKADGTRGDYLKLFAKAYGREGERCEKCGGIIMKIRVAGRGTYYCPNCQK